MIRSIVLAAAVSVAVPFSAHAQEPPVGPPLTSGYDDGFFVQTGNGDYRLLFGMNLQFDGRFSVDDPPVIVDTFTIRKARPAFAGRLTRYIEFKVMPDFGGGRAVLQDAFFDTRFSRGDALRVRVGKGKVPIGYEILLGDPNLFFPERAIATNLVPLRDLGIQAIGQVAGGRLAYAGGVFNGSTDATSTADGDSNSAKELAGRVVLQPWRMAAGYSAVSGLGFHVGGSIGNEDDGALPAYRTSIGQTFFTYRSDVSATGRHVRITPAAFYFYKPVGVFGEYIRSSQDVSRTGRGYTIANHAMNVTTVLVLTGERAGVGTMRPRRTFDPAAGHWGAAELVARFSHLEVDGEAFVEGLAAAGASRRADQWSVGVNWFPTAFTTWYLTYERTAFDENVDGSRPVEHALIFRAQLAF